MADGKMLNFGSRLKSPDRMCCVFYMTSINLAEPYLKLMSGYRCACNILMANEKRSASLAHTRGTRHPVLEKVQDLIIIFMHSFIHMGGNTFASSLLDL